MASQLVTVQWIRPQRYEGMIETIARSRIRGKVEAGSECRAMWRGKPYRVKIVDEARLSEQVVVASVRRHSSPKPGRPKKTPDSAVSKRSPVKQRSPKQEVRVTLQKTNINTWRQTKVAAPSNNTRNRADRRPSLPGSPVRARTVVRATVHAPPTTIEQPTSTSRTVTRVTEPDSSSPNIDTSVHSTTRPGRPANGPFTPPLDRLDPKVAKYLKGLEERVVRLEELYKASKKK